jgi:DNA-binding SARP family transcriptional activator
MQALQIALFGHVTVVHAQGQAPLRLSRSTQALLAYLLLQQHLVPRDVLMDVFWMDHSPDRARSNLTTALWRLRQLLEPGDVRPGTYLTASSTGEVGFNWDSDHQLDTESFEQRIYPLLRKPVSNLGEDDIVKNGMNCLQIIGIRCPLIIIGNVR